METPNFEDQKREAQVEKLVGFLDRINAYEFFEELRSNPEKIKDIDFNKFEDFLIRINGIARDIPINDRREDGDEVHLDGFVDSASVPEQVDKVPLLNKAYESSSVLAHPEDVAYMLPLIINAVHLFEDGNGRSSRVIHLLLKPHASKEAFNEELRKALGVYGRLDSYDISPGLISADTEKIVLANHGILFGTENYGWDPHPPKELSHFWASAENPKSAEAKMFMKLLRDDYQFCFIAAYNYLKQKGLLDKVLLSLKTEEGDRIMLSPNMMDQLLQAEDWDNITRNISVLKKEKVEVMINAFVEPEKYLVLDGTVTLRDGLIKRVEEQHGISNPK